MMIFVTVIHVIVCLVLIGVILLQAGRGQGLGTSFGGGEGTQSVFGTRSADFLSKATTVCAIVFLFTCIGLDVLHARKGASLFDSTRTLKSEDLEALQEALADLQEEGNSSSESAAAGVVTDAAGEASQTVSAEDGIPADAASEAADVSLPVSEDAHPGT